MWQRLTAAIPTLLNLDANMGDISVTSLEPNTVCKLGPLQMLQDQQILRNSLKFQFKITKRSTISTNINSRNFPYILIYIKIAKLYLRTKRQLSIVSYYLNNFSSNTCYSTICLGVIGNTSPRCKQVLRCLLRQPIHSKASESMYL